MTIKPYHPVLDFVARVGARKPLCRNPEWLEVSTQFTETVFCVSGLPATLPEVGPWMTWNKPQFSRLRKLDSSHCDP